MDWTRAFFFFLVAGGSTGRWQPGLAPPPNLGITIVNMGAKYIYGPQSTTTTSRQVSMQR